jgi:hypothetical protein
MKYPVNLMFSDDAPDMWEIVTNKGDHIYTPELAGMYNKLVSQYNTLYHELAEYIPYAAPDVPVDTSPANREVVDHTICADFHDDCLEGHPCADCDLNNGK